MESGRRRHDANDANMMHFQWWSAGLLPRRLCRQEIVRASFLPRATQDVFSDQLVEVPEGGCAAAASGFLEVSAGDAPLSPGQLEGLCLPLIQVQVCEKFVSQPIAPEGDNELVAALVKSWFG